jgi:hypothetical protein
MAESEAQREQKAQNLAFERGKEAAQIGGRLAEHDRHLKAINGSIDSMNTSLKGVDDRVNELRIEIATMKTKLGFYAALGSLVGGGVVALVVGLATKAGGG